MVESTLSTRLARLIRARPAGVGDLQLAERHVRDWLGAMAAGGATSAGRVLRSYAGERTDVEGRVFLAAALSHITETDDLHRGSVTHPGCVVVPTAWLLGSELGRRGHAVLHAVLAGYEAVLRIGEALGPGHYRVFHNTATAGVFGAAAAAAQLLGLDEERWVWAFGSAGTQAAGLWQFNQDATMSKHLHAGHAAEAGLRSALLAKGGFTGPGAILEGEKGFFRGLCPDPIPERVLAPAPGWKLQETSFKPYPSCRHTHAAIDAALEIRDRMLQAGDSPKAIAQLRIETYPAALRFTDNPAPVSTYAAKFSIQFCVATALVQGRPTLGAFDGEHLADASVRDPAARASVAVRDAFAEAYPAHWRSAVEVVTEAGRTYLAERDGARGDPEWPMMDQELDDKARDLLAYGTMTPAASELMLRACRQLVEDGPLPPLPWVAGALPPAAFLKTLRRWARDATSSV